MNDQVLLFIASIFLAAGLVLMDRWWNFNKKVDEDVDKILERNKWKSK